MDYLSTRGGMQPSSFSDITLKGLAPDGGLTVPRHLPDLSEKLDIIRRISYPNLASLIISEFAEDISSYDLVDIINHDTYTKSVFGTEDITPVFELSKEGMYLQELSNGPTLSFKDIALQLLGNLFEYILEQRDETLNILGATSGDTGSAAIYGIKGKKRINVFMMHPHNRTSKFQEAQMTSVLDSNIYNIAIEGDFDDCQRMSKALSKPLGMGGVNSYNWARIAAQTVYYFKGYLDVVNRNRLSVNTKVDFVVPTGNFGNILAGYYAMIMGCPIRRLVLATNENNVLDVFFKTGRYERKDAIPTDSPSMDISVASNFERLLYDDLDQDPEKVKEHMAQLQEKGFFELSGAYLEKAQNSGIVSGTATAEQRAKAMLEEQQRSGILMDFHTANGYVVGSRYKTDDTPMIVLSTAKPIKFEEDLREIPGIIMPERPEEHKDLEQREKRVYVMKTQDEVKSFIKEKLRV